MSKTSSYEYLQFLSRSRSRVCLLGSLNEDPKSPYQLTQELDISRRGIQRNLSALVDQGWAEKTNGEYHLTASGALITEQYIELCTTLDVIDEYEPFYNHLPDLTHAPSPAWLHDAEIVVATEADQLAPVRHWVSRFQSGSNSAVRALLPGMCEIAIESHIPVSSSEDGTPSVELILGESALGTAREAELEAIDTALPTDSFDLYAHPIQIEIGLTLTEQNGFISSFDDTGRIRALIECDDVAFLDWATGLYHRYRNRARMVSTACVSEWRTSEQECDAC